jgi:4-hydroxyphenylpyruvate dioxygenase
MTTPRLLPTATPFTRLLSAATTTAPFMPGFRAVTADPVARPTGLKHVDHMVGNVGWHAMDEWVSFYAHVMGFQLYQHFDDKDISTEYSALMSKVMSNGNGYVKFPINEPAEGRRKVADRRVP